MTAEELQKVLAAHKLWRASCGAGGTMADLSGADLSGANLSRADLSRADLRWADLSGANLSKADLSGADLRWADLSGADLRWADLLGVNLRGADLSGVNLRGASLREVNLSGVNNLRHCTIGGTWHGEAARNLLCVELPDGLWFYCGCFRGQEPELRQYIANGKEEYRASRTRALELCLELMEIK